jgi:hypothetical protein
LDLYLESCGGLESDEYVPLSILAKKFPYSQEYLSLLARQGKIDAHKKARNWLATENSISEYLSSIKVTSHHICNWSDFDLNRSVKDKPDRGCTPVRRSKGLSPDLMFNRYRH